MKFTNSNEGKRSNFSCLFNDCLFVLVSNSRIYQKRDSMLRENNAFDFANHSYTTFNGNEEVRRITIDEIKYTEV